MIKEDKIADMVPLMHTKNLICCNKDFSRSWVYSTDLWKVSHRDIENES